MIVTEVPFDRRRDASVHDAGLPRGCHIRGVDGIEVQADFGHTLEQGGGTEKSSLGSQGCHVLQPIRVADAMVCVHTKADAGYDSRRYIHRRNGGEACHILSGGA